MSAQLTVAIVGDSPDAILQRAILATLPNDFRVVDGEADILLMSGREGNAAAVLAKVGETTRAIILTSPAGLDAGSRAQLARIETGQGIPVQLGLAYAPWFTGEGLAFDPALEEDVAILDLTALVADATMARDALLEQLHIGRTMMGSLGSPRILMDSPAAIVIEVEGGSPPVRWRMTACIGLEDSLVVERIARGRRSRVKIARDAHARPAQVGHHDASGSHLPTPVYQSGYRSGWIALYEALQGPVVPTHTLARLEADIALLSF